MEIPEKIRELIDNKRESEAIVELDALLEGAHNDAGLLYLRGRLHWKLGNRREAISDYSRARAADPSSPATTALEQASGIMSYFNPDLLNP